MRCYLMRKGHIASVREMPGLSDEAAIDIGRATFEKERQFDGFEVWDWPECSPNIRRPRQRRRPRRLGRRGIVIASGSAFRPPIGRAAMYKIVFLKGDEELSFMPWPDKKGAIAQASEHFPHQADQKAVTSVRVIDSRTRDVVFVHPDRRQAPRSS